MLSPTSATLNTLFRNWSRELEQLKQRPRAAPAPAAMTGEALNFAALASKVTAVDRAAANGSSIALLLEHRGASALLAAAAFPTVLAPALKALALHRKTPKGLKVDAFKLSHYGSRANTTLELLKVVQADHCVISTNGAIFGHPNDEAIARVLIAGGRTPALWFNYATAETRRWVQPQMQQAHGYKAYLPAAQAGVALKLGQP